MTEGDSSCGGDRGAGTAGKGGEGRGPGRPSQVLRVKEGGRAVVSSLV